MVAVTLPKASRGLSFVAVLGFTYALTRYSHAPGATRSRLLFFGVLLGLAYFSLAGLVFDVPGITVVCATVLLLVGFTQFVLFAYILPTAAVLLIDGVASGVPRPRQSGVEDDSTG